MAITSIRRDWNGEVDIVRLISSDTLAQVATAGYLTAQIDNLAIINNGTWEWKENDFVLVNASDDSGLFTLSSNLSSLDLYTTAGNGAVTLPVVANDFVVFDGTLGALKDLGFSASDATKTKVVMANAATVLNHIMVSTDASGTSGNLTGTAINDGSIQAGRDSGGAVAGNLISYPATTANGRLIISALNAGGAFDTTIRNTTMGQSTVYSIPDILAATGWLVASTTALRMKSVAGAAAAGGAAAQSFTDTFCTAASNVVGNWNTQTNAASVLKIVPGNGSFVVTSTADAGVGTFNYIITK